jgi:flagellar motor switch protein FliM
MSGKPSRSSTIAGGRGARSSSRKPVTYDFRRPDKFSKDHIRSIQSIHETFDRYVSNHLSAQVRAAVHVELVQLEQTTLGDYLDHLPSQTVLYLAELEPLVGRVIVQLDFGIASRIIDRMLGGAGEERPSFTSATVTEIELSLLQDVGNGIFSELVGAWDHVVKLQPSRCEVVLSAQQLQGMLPSEIVLLVRHDVRLFDGQGAITVVLPASTLEPIMPRLNARVLFANPRRTTGSESIADLAAQLQEVPLRVRVEIGRTVLTVAELLALDAGDVVWFDAPVTRPVLVYVEDEPCFLGFAGRRGRSLAVRIAGLSADEWSVMATEVDEGGDARWRKTHAAD